MKVLSLFDGISCARVALDRLDRKVQYFASEVDESAMKISVHNWPDIIQLGNVCKVDCTIPALRGLDLLIGGSPCQDLSRENTKRKGLSGARSGLFYEYLRILKESKPRYFVLENVASMAAESRDIITKEMGVEPIMIDAALVSAQVRRRYFWTNIPGVIQPADRGIYLKDVLQKDAVGEINDAQKKLFKKLSGGRLSIREATKRGFAIIEDGDSVDISFPKSTTRRGRVGKKVKNLKTSLSICVFTGGIVRPLSPLECERLQSLPDGYTQGGGITESEDRNARQRVQRRGHRAHSRAYAYSS